MAKDFYAVLGVEPDDDVTIIKRRYRQMVRQYHPDVATNRDAAHEMMLSINEAWTTLSDPAERARYDRGRRPQSPPAPPPSAPRSDATRSDAARAETASGATPSGATARAAIGDGVRDHSARVRLGR